MLQDRLTLGRERLDAALEALFLLCEPVQPPKGELEHIHYFCGNTEIADDLKTHEPQRVAFYKGVVALLRAYANVADEMAAAGYSEQDAKSIKTKLDQYLAIREIVRKASGETLDLKPFEADMRHLIDTYIEASEPRKISPFDGIGLLDLIVKTGIADAIANKLADMQGNQQAIAETIENNVRSKIIKDSLTDPAYFEKMSALLNEIIKLRKERAIEYEEYLKRIADIATKVQTGPADPTSGKLDSPGKRAIFNNLQNSPLLHAVKAAEADAPYGPADSNEDPAVALALKIDKAVRLARPDGWRGVQVKELVIKRALYDTLKDVDEVERLFLVINAQLEY
jgi:type I restriction enzyme R subunit